MNRGRWLIAATAVSTIGWGTILPYQYAYAARSRSWGAGVAAAAASLFSVGALVSAPLAGRLADRFSPVRIAVLARLGAALAAFELITADSATTFLLGMSALGSASPRPIRASPSSCCTGSTAPAGGWCSHGCSPRRRSAWGSARSSPASSSTSAVPTAWRRVSPSPPSASPPALR